MKWLISAGLHALLLAAATIFYFERLAAVDETECPLVLRPSIERPISELAPVREWEDLREILERRGIPTDVLEESDEVGIMFSEDDIPLEFARAREKDALEITTSGDRASGLPGEGVGVERFMGLKDGRFDAMRIGTGAFEGFAIRTRVGWGWSRG